MLLSFLLACLLPLAQAPDGAQAHQENPDLYVPARRWALVIGAGDYPHLGELSFAVRDAKAFSGTLVERFGFEPSTVSLLVDDAEDPVLRPTAGNMFLALRRLLADPRLQESDLFLFYFAGHGIGEATGDYLLPVDAALETVTDVGLSVDNVIAELVGAGMNNVLFVVDGCRTGNQNRFGARLWERAEEANLAVMLSCEPGEQSFEDRRLGGGVFTHFLVEALEDPSLVDSSSGALWASRVAERVREKAVSWTSRGFDGQQVPQVWSDPTRDVLLGAELPGDAVPLISAFQSGAKELDSARYMAAAARFAELLYSAERYDECAELLKAAEQMGVLTPQLLYLLADSLQMQGRSSEGARIRAKLRAAAPDSFYTLTAIAHDLSGETSASERYLASRRLFDTYPIESEDLALLVAFNMANGAPHDEARAVLHAMLPHFTAGTRAQAYAKYMALLLDGEYGRALELLAAAEDLPGGYPGNWRLRFERFGLLREAQRASDVRALLDQCIADWPDDPTWFAERASVRFQSGDWAGAKADAVAALERDPEPWVLLLAVRAAGIDSGELHEAVSELAARDPLSWQAQLALAMTTLDTAESHQAALDAAKRLAPVLGTWTTTVAGIQYERAKEAFRRGQVDALMVSNLRYDLLDILADRAAGLDQDEGWPLLCELTSICSRQVQLAELIELHLGPVIDAGKLQRSLVARASMAFLEVGRLERFREVVAQASPESGLAIGSQWLEVAWLVCAGRDSEARALLDGLPAPTEQALPSSHFVRACLAARAGEVETARALLAAAPAPPPGDGLTTALLGLTLEALGDTAGAEQAFAPLLEQTGSQPFFAKAAAWRALGARELEPLEHQTLAWAAGRDGVGNPLAASLSFAEEPGVEAFLGTVEFQLSGDDSALSAAGATLLLSVRKEGKVSGIIERPEGDVWSLKGTLDAFGNLEAELVGAAHSARVFAKLAPPEVYTAPGPLLDFGVLFSVMDREGRVTGWIARPTS